MAGYSPTPLQKKLGIRTGMRCFVHNEPEAYWEWISPLPDGVRVVGRGQVDFAHVFVKERNTFERIFAQCKKRLAKDGMLWISWPKKASKVTTDLDETVIRDYGLQQGLVDVKVCAIDEVWSGLKFVYRLADR